MLKHAIAVCVALGVSTPVFAAEYWIVRGPDKKCKVVETRPTEKTITIIGDKAFITREEADRQVKVVCKERM